MRPSVLIVDDDKITRDSLSKALSDSYNTCTAKNGQEAMVLLDNENIDVVITDIKIPLMSGIDLMEKIHSSGLEPIVIMVTGYATVESAVDAMKKGAYDYITKPVNIDRLQILIEKALEDKRLRRDNILLRQKIREHFCFANIIGNSRWIREIIDVIHQISSTKATVLIQGESGTGKELIANAIHYNSPVSLAPFIKVSCATLAEGVLESEIFGHEKGAFTGALYTKKGRFELADGGTLFLDEVGDIPLSTQVKLLRVLQEQEFERVGGTKTIKVDVRIIAATNKRLEDLVKENKFREDLYYRLRVVTIEVPPLRERKEDIPLLTVHFLKHFSESHGKEVKNISPEAMQWMIAYDWPGNVRELMNCIESMVVMSKGDTINLESLPDYIFSREDKNEISVYKPVPIIEIERHAIQNTLKSVGWNKAKAARMLGIGLRTLYRKLEVYGIKNKPEK